MTNPGRRPLRRMLPIALGAAVLMVSSCGGTAQTEAEPAVDPSAASVAEQVQAAAPGPFAVGRSTIDVASAERPDRTLTADVWYPVDPANTGGAQPAAYEFLPGLGYTSDVALTDAPAADGEFPLLVYSHGSGGFRWIATFFTEFMASKGYVVVAPDHKGNTAVDQLTGQADQREQSAYDRPADVSATIDAMLAVNDDPAAALAGRVDEERIAVSGHSFGGFTSLGVVGGHSNDVGSTPADDRIGAVILMAAWTELLTDEELQAVDVPVLMISSTGDERTPIDPNTTRPEKLMSGPLLRIDVTGGGHNSFTDVCQLDQRVGSAPNIPQAVKDELAEGAEPTCGPDVLSVDIIHEIINSYSAAFLADTLSNSTEFAAMLDCVAPPEDAICTVVRN